MKRLFSNNKQLYIFLAVAAVSAAAAITVILYHNTFRFGLARFEEFNVTAAFFNRVYFDFDNDGEYESYAIHTHGGVTAFTFNNDQDQAVEELALTDVFFTDRWTTEKDISGDGFKEILFFYLKNDTIFFSSYDYKNKRMLDENIFVLAKPDTIFDNTWQIKMEIGGFYTYSDGNEEIIFSVYTGYAQFPRAVYSFNPKTKKITRSFHSGFNTNSIFFYDLDFDGNNEIILNTFSPGNNHRLPQNKMPRFTDMKTWFVVLNEDFTVKIIDSIDATFGGYSSGIVETPEGQRLYSYGSADYLKVDSAKTKITVYSPKGDVIRDTLFLSASSGLDFDSLMISEYIFSISRDSVLTVLDYNFKELKKIKLRFPLKTLAVDLDGDNEKEYLFYSKSGILILDEDLEPVFEEIFPEKLLETDQDRFVNYYFTKERNRMNFSGTNRRYEFSIVKNPFYTLIPIAGIGAGALFYLIAFFSLKAAERIKVLFSNLILSTRRSSNGIIVVSVKGKIIYKNRSCLKILGFNNLNGNNFDEFFRASELYIVYEQLKAAEKRGLKLIDYHTANRLKLLRVTYLPIFTSWKALAAYYIMIENISKEIVNERSKVLAHSIQKVAHEIKTPLSSVLLNIDMIEKKTEGDEKFTEIEKNINTSREEIRRVKNFINNYLKFAVQSEPVFVNLRLADTVKNSLIKFSSYTEKGIKIKLEIDDGVFVSGDELQLEEVFHALIENAIDALSGVGVIEIKASETAGGKYKVSVIDNGHGIEKENLKKLFHPYFTTKKDGTGMGLAIAKKILEDHGSMIEINSTEKNGTEVSFYLIKSKELN